MINLIPKEEKKKMKKDFLFRVLTVSLVVFGFVVIAGAVALLPSYFQAVIENSLAREKLALQQNEPVSVSEAQVMAEISDLDKKLQIIESASENKFIVSDRVINDVIFKKMSDIKVTDISYENNVTKGREIRISGEAPSRERLLLFRLALEASGKFQKVDLPISNFVRGKNITFSLTLVPA